MGERAGRALRGAAICLALGAAACSGGAAQAPGDGGSSGSACGEPRRLALLPPELAEASGMVGDPRRPGLFWLHNDSDNDLVLYGVDSSGRLLAAYEVTGATDTDPEDLALGRCGNERCLYLGDIGDNFSLRSEVYVHRLPLPPLPPAAPGADAGPVRGRLAAELTLRLRYEDGRRDAEGLAVDDRSGEILVVSKGREGIAAVYAAPLDAAEGEGPVALRRLGALRVPLGANTGQLLTAADLSPDGRHLAVRSYTTLFLFPWPGTAVFDSAAEPATASLVAAAEPQGEGLAFGADREEIYLASEGRGGRPPQLSAVRCPGP